MAQYSTSSLGEDYQEIIDEGRKAFDASN